MTPTQFCPLIFRRDLREQYSYQGEEARFRGKPVLLGKRVIFESAEPTVLEWRTLLRTFYADGGSFASQNTYREFLESYDQPDGRLVQAIQLETAHHLSALTKAQLADALLESGNERQLRSKSSLICFE